MNHSFDLANSLENIYISPLESCNLNCQLCYTHKTTNVLNNSQIETFISTYSNYLQQELHLELKSILFCGGEVFILPEFTRLINRLLAKKIFISIITNGTLNRLSQISDPPNCQLLVSLDGPKAIHDQNRGAGNFQKTIDFVKSALDLGFPTEIMFLVTPDSYPYKDSFSSYLQKELSYPIKLNYITQKTHFYTQNHPLSNQTNLSSALKASEILDIKKNYPSIPSKNFGCFQLSLQSDGHIYGCCESPYPLGSITNSPSDYINRFIQSLKGCKACPLSKRDICFGCCTPEFLCGYKKELSLTTCQDVVKFFNP